MNQINYLEEYIILADRISWKNKEFVRNILNTTKELDLTYYDGQLFHLAVEDNSTEIVQILLNYFKENQLSQYPEDSYEYLALKKKMHEILEVAIEDVELSDEMKNILSEYINFDEESDIGGNLTDTESDIGEYLKSSEEESGNHSSDGSTPPSFIPDTISSLTLTTENLALLGEDSGPIEFAFLDQPNANL